MTDKIIIDKKDVEKIIREYLMENLTIDKELCGGEYGSRRYTTISLKLNNREISTINIDEW